MLLPLEISPEASYLQDINMFRQVPLSSWHKAVWSISNYRTYHICAVLDEASTNWSIKEIVHRFCHTGRQIILAFQKYLCLRCPFSEGKYASDASVCNYWQFQRKANKDECLLFAGCPASTWLEQAVSLPPPNWHDHCSQLPHVLSSPPVPNPKENKT